MSRIPDPAEFAAWKADYKRRYAAPIHNLGYTAFNAMSNDGTRTNDDQIPFLKPQPLTDPNELVNVALSLADAITMERAAAEMDARAAAVKSVGRARLSGYDAGRSGKPATHNPFPDRTDDFYSWYRYWLGGNKDYVAEHYQHLNLTTIP